MKHYRILITYWYILLMVNAGEVFKVSLLPRSRSPSPQRPRIISHGPKPPSASPLRSEVKRTSSPDSRTWAWTDARGPARMDVTGNDPTKVEPNKRRIQGGYHPKASMLDFRTKALPANAKTKDKSVGMVEGRRTKAFVETAKDGSATLETMDQRAYQKDYIPAGTGFAKYSRGSSPGEAGPSHAVMKAALTGPGRVTMISTRASSSESDSWGSSGSDSGSDVSL